MVRGLVWKTRRNHERNLEKNNWFGTMTRDGKMKKNRNVNVLLKKNYWFGFWFNFPSLVIVPNQLFFSMFWFVVWFGFPNQTTNQLLKIL
jgi:hypothetical protein